MTTQIWSVGLPALLFLTVACQLESTDQAQEDDLSAEAALAAPDSAPGAMSMERMEGMGGMQMQSDMMAHMQTMHAMHGDSLMMMMPQHGQMLGNMMTHMDREMQSMNLSPDSLESALADSLRSDLMRMPGMSAPEMEAFMPGHQARVMRMMEMHGSMMSGDR
jgi:hypothetical protein